VNASQHLAKFYIKTRTSIIIHAYSFYIHNILLDDLKFLMGKKNTQKFSKIKKYKNIN
jgi:hypothetical protein